MAIEFDCPACDAAIRVSEKAIGKKGRCPKCGVLLLVPDPDDFDDEEELEDEAPVTEPEPEPEPEPAPKPEPAPVDASEAIDGPVFISVDSREDSAVEASAGEASATVTDGPVTDRPDAELAAPAAATTPAAEADETAAPTPAPFDPDNPFAFTGSPARSTSSAYSRHRRQNRSMSTQAKASIGAAVIGIALLGIGAWLLYDFVQPDLSGELTGERFRSVELPAVAFAAPAKGVTADDTALMMDILTNEGLPLRSEYIEVRLSAVDGRPNVNIGPGPRSRPVRVALGGHAGIHEALPRQRDAILKLKQQELSTATAGLFRDYAAYVDKGTPIAKLSEYRDKVGLNAAVGAVGYAVEAVVSGHPFLCAYEDTEGNCYFFLPEGVSTFQLRGRKLADGTTPLPVDFAVTLVDAKTPVLNVSEPPTRDSKDDDQPKDDEPSEADEKPDGPSADEKPAAEMQDDSNDTPENPPGSS